ncbi:MAG: hypothetical protein QXR53_01450 [Candidatus Norongarragalinales archaeon]
MFHHGNRIATEKTLSYYKIAGNKAESLRQLTARFAQKTESMLDFEGTNLDYYVVELYSETLKHLGERNAKKFMQFYSKRFGEFLLVLKQLEEEDEERHDRAMP